MGRSLPGLAAQYPQCATQIIAVAKASFLDGDQWAYMAGVVAVLLGGLLVFVFFPKHADEEALLAQYQREDRFAAERKLANRVWYNCLPA